MLENAGGIFSVACDSSCTIFMIIRGMKQQVNERVIYISFLVEVEFVHASSYEVWCLF